MSNIIVPIQCTAGAIPYINEKGNFIIYITLRNTFVILIS